MCAGDLVADRYFEDWEASCGEIDFNIEIGKWPLECESDDASLNEARTHCCGYVCPDTTDPCECGDICGWNSELEICDANSFTSCSECSDGCIHGSCASFEIERESDELYCPSLYNPELECQCDGSKQ